MRKTIVMALITLLVMLVASCDSFITSPGAEKAEYTADGRRLVNLSVKVSGAAAGSRALTLALAKDEAKYMEVIFYDGSTYYRAAGKLTQTLKLRIPAGKYDKTNAILLIGTRDDAHTLLAVGTCDAPNPQEGDTITFDVTVLKADLYAGTANPSFAITTTFNHDPGDGSNDDLNKDFIGQTTEGTFADDETTCFQVPTGRSDITAKLDITGFGSVPSANIAIVNDISTPVEKSITFTPYTGTTPAIGVAKTDIDFDIDSAGVGTIDFKFTTSTAQSYIITFDIPVVGFAEYVDVATTSGLVDQITWHIRGGTTLGTKSYQSQTGDGEEGVAILVTPKPFKMLNIKVGPVTITK